MLLPKPKTLLEFYSRPARWTQDVTARDKNGNPTEMDSGRAVALCLGAAIRHIYGEEGEGPVIERLLALVNQDRDDTQAYELLSSWNDEEERSFRDVRKLVTTARL